MLNYFLSCIKDKKNISTTILTNMSHRKSLNLKLLTERTKLGITIDGMVQEEVKQVQKGLNIERVLANIKELTYVHDNLYLNYTLYTQNIKSIP